MINIKEIAWKKIIIPSVIIGGIAGTLFGGTDKLKEMLAPECPVVEILPVSVLSEAMMKKLTPAEGCQMYDVLQLKPDDPSLPCQRINGPLNFCAE